MLFTFEVEHDKGILFLVIGNRLVDGQDEKIFPTPGGFLQSNSEALLRIEDQYFMLTLGRNAEHPRQVISTRTTQSVELVDYQSLLPVGFVFGCENCWDGHHQHHKKYL